MLSKSESSLVPYSAHRNFTSQMSMTCRTLFSAIRKRTCKLIQRAQKTHMSIKVDHKCHSLFGEHRKRTCQVRLGTHRKCTCQVRLTSSLALYSDSAQTEDFWIFFPILKLSLWIEWIPVSHWIDTGIKLFSLSVCYWRVAKGGGFQSHVTLNFSIESRITGNFFLTNRVSRRKE